nr:MAG: internal scaffolding protein [Microvirus sp.]
MRNDGTKLITELGGRRRVQTINTEPTRTQQQFAEECDINYIMKKYETTGEFSTHFKQGGRYADFSNITDFQDMLHTVQYAQDAFMTLPAEIRSRFRNDPQQILTFLQDPKNYDEGVKLGLLQPRDNQNSGNQTSEKKTKKQNAKNEAEQKMKSDAVEADE